MFEDLFAAGKPVDSGNYKIKTNKNSDEYIALEQQNIRKEIGNINAPVYGGRFKREEESGIYPC